jgi:hypothetical protein
MPARAICGGFRAWEESSSSSQEAMNPDPKSAEPKTFKLLHIIED